MKFISEKERLEKELNKRGETLEDSVCISGEDVDGVHRQYTRDYRRWNFKAMWAKIAVCLSEEERSQWFKDSPPPKNKFED